MPSIYAVTSCQQGIAPWPGVRVCWRLYRGWAVLLGAGHDGAASSGEEPCTALVAANGQFKDAPACPHLSNEVGKLHGCIAWATASWKDMCRFARAANALSRCGRQMGLWMCSTYRCCTHRASECRAEQQCCQSPT